MSKKIVISLDIGTSNLCGLALSCDSLQPAAICSEVNDTEIANLPSGYHEQGPLRIRDLSFGLIQKLLSEKKVRENDVVGIGIVRAPAHPPDARPLLRGTILEEVPKVLPRQAL